MRHHLALPCLLLTSSIALAEDPPPPPTMASVLAETRDADWRRPDPANTVYLELASGRVVIELAPEFAPRHVDNIRRLVRAGYFDGSAVLRSQENYVVQWGDPQADDAERARPLGEAERSLPPEFSVVLDPAAAFTRLPDGDVYAPEVGFQSGFPLARDPGAGSAWMAHCYGAVGVSRGNTADSGNGSGLYVVIGHSPRHLDRNITLVGRVLRGMELLTTLPRGGGPLGFYERPEQHVPISRIRLAADLPEAERSTLEVMRTDTPNFARLIEARRTRREDWFLHPTGRIELCNVPVPVRDAIQRPQ
jgi:peptidylprolyl isomerase